LEFLGDAVIDFIAGEMLYLDFPDLPEGDLTRLRASLVSEASLAAIGTAMEIGASLRMGRGEEGSGGRSRPSIVCAAVEAVIGALYIDSGMETARAFAVPLLRERLAQVQARSLDRDARSVLQERAQAALGFTPQYTVIAQTGPDHARQWTVQVQIGDRVAGQGMGHSKQAASQAAAHDALTRM
ncbi:MAG: ribonuclease III, partial [Chloroflexota bacterium]|nr:ribonuclease III [Chloroflexota bacterium]